MANRVQAANNALAARLEAAFIDPKYKHFRNPDGQRAFDRADFVVSLMDDEEPETINVISGPIYDLKLTPLVTLASKQGSAERRDDAWSAVDIVRDALAADVTLGGFVEDARIEAVEPADMDRAKWAGGGVDLTIRLLFAAPSAAG